RAPRTHLAIPRGCAGTSHAVPAEMRAAVMILLCACAGSTKPAVIPKLSELPVEAQRRDAVLDSAHAQPGPEQQPKTKKERKAETYAATAAAVIGWLMSDSENVTLGVSSSIDETGIEPVEPQSQREAREEAAKTPAAAPKPLERGDEPLVPWIDLKR